jgi:N-acetylmuramoyl-L-alanine amidase
VTESELIEALTDTEVVACTVYGEARGAGVEGMRAVADVIRNRVQAGHYGDWREVCLRKWQFSCWTPVGGPSNYLTVISAAKSIVFKTQPPPGLAQCFAIAVEVVQGHRPDTVLGSTHYITDWLYSDPLRCPKWARRLKPACVIGAHCFFNDVS